MNFYSLNFVSLNNGHRTVDHASGMPFITRIFLGELQGGISIRIELYNRGVMIGTGPTTYEAFKNKKYIGIYDINTFDIFTLAKHLNWTLPQGYLGEVFEGD